ncbi:MAG: 50S ribosomal protein L29 [Lysobacterales bacterium CG02_land_8_20_14_3_00_62_12]|jgi:large subunit ribosomal protein L29|nr:MAG: 50S ribosomal protein L29 [Xanthomonadales bacterium CG02_land_8_20_14_3_00_62_12]PJA42322.1 MAG: 50S ribosomal protein L29 [Xanthomonadales bacterium CG_4_9_14_3_um_filter_62_6]
MDIKELSNKSIADLDKHVLDLRTEQFNLRMQRGSGQLTQTHQIRNVRKEIARTKMVLGQKK